MTKRKCEWCKSPSGDEGDPCPACGYTHTIETGTYEEIEIDEKRFVPYSIPVTRSVRAELDVNWSYDWEKNFTDVLNGCGTFEREMEYLDELVCLAERDREMAEEVDEQYG